MHSVSTNANKATLKNWFSAIISFISLMGVIILLYDDFHSSRNEYQYIGHPDHSPNDIQPSPGSHHHHAIHSKARSNFGQRQQQQQRHRRQLASNPSYSDMKQTANGALSDFDKEYSSLGLKNDDAYDDDDSVNMDGILDNFVILVTGAGSGIGLATVRRALQECATVIMVGRNESKIMYHYNNISQSSFYINIDYCESTNYNSPPMLDYQIADIRNITQLRNVMTYIYTTYHQFNGAANIAGIGGPIDYLDSYNMDKWLYSYHDPILNNLYGNINEIRSEIELFKRLGNNYGVILNAASINGYVTSPEIALYTASKHGIIGLTKSVALSYAYPNVNNSNLQLRINAIAPGLVNTPLTRNQVRLNEGLQPFECYNGSNNDIIDYGCPDITQNDPQWLEMLAGIESASESTYFPTRRVIDAREMANVIVFLLSNYTSAVTGDIWIADSCETAGMGVV